MFGVGLCLLALGVGAVTVVGFLIWGFVSKVKSKAAEKGVVVRDGISASEAALVLDAINESISESRATETLIGFQNALSAVLAARGVAGLAKVPSPTAVV